ncbi:hypothetical protein DFJ73DRAFT_961094 [Zopfochytrium polystomum]|nr:hypothetical protein DFJ73DRAFT_961094 [Zopfochytrium polystomum]
MQSYPNLGFVPYRNRPLMQNQGCHWDWRALEERMISDGNGGKTAVHRDGGFPQYSAEESDGDDASDTDGLLYGINGGVDMEEGVVTTVDANSEDWLESFEQYIDSATVDNVEFDGPSTGPSREENPAFAEPAGFGHDLPSVQPPNRCRSSRPAARPNHSGDAGTGNSESSNEVIRADGGGPRLHRSNRKRKERYSPTKGKRGLQTQADPSPVASGKILDNSQLISTVTEATGSLTVECAFERDFPKKEAPLSLDVCVETPTCPRNGKQKNPKLGYWQFGDNLVARWKNRFSTPGIQSPEEYDNGVITSLCQIVIGHAINYYRLGDRAYLIRLSEQRCICGGDSLLRMTFNNHDAIVCSRCRKNLLGGRVTVREGASGPWKMATIQWQYICCRCQQKRLRGAGRNGCYLDALKHLVKKHGNEGFVGSYPLFGLLDFALANVNPKTEHGA